MTTRIMPNGMKVHFVHPDGTHYKEGEKFPRELQERAVRAVLDSMQRRAEQESLKKQYNH